MLERGSLFLQVFLIVPPWISSLLVSNHFLQFCPMPITISTCASSSHPVSLSASRSYSTALWRWNSRTVQLTLLWRMIRWLLVYSRLCIYHHSFRTFSSPLKATLHPLAVTPRSSLSSPKQALIYFLSLWTCLFWIFHINGIRRCIWDWLLSLSTTFSRLIYVVTSSRMPCLSLLNAIVWMDHILFFHSFEWDIWVVFTFWIL